MKRPLTTLMVVILTAMTLAGCGGGTHSSGTHDTQDDLSKADLTFVQSMIPHHEQAVEMARLATTRASSTQVKALAETSEAAQGPEIETMQGWLDDQQASDSEDSMEGMDHGSGMPGMLGDSVMKQLAETTGPAFDRLFLTMMVERHEGAIEMARTEQAEGRKADVVALAKDIETAQVREVARMKQLLGG